MEPEAEPARPANPAFPRRRRRTRVTLENIDADGEPSRTPRPPIPRRRPRAPETINVEPDSEPPAAGVSWSSRVIVEAIDSDSDDEWPHWPSATGPLHAIAGAVVPPDPTPPRDVPENPAGPPRLRLFAELLDSQDDEWPPDHAPDTPATVALPPAEQAAPPTETAVWSPRPSPAAHEAPLRDDVQDDVPPSSTSPVREIPWRLIGIAAGFVALVTAAFVVLASSNDLPLVAALPAVREPEPPTPTPSTVVPAVAAPVPSAAQRAAEQRLSELAQACRKRHHALGGPKIRVRYDVAGNGRAAQPQSSVPGPLGECLVTAVRRTRFPKARLIKQEAVL